MPGDLPEFDAKPDYRYWAKMPALDREEVISLSLGCDPDKVTWEIVEPHVATSSDAAKYAAQRRLIVRAYETGQLPQRVAPADFLSWAKSNSIPYPADFEEAVTRQGKPVANWKIEWQTSQERLSTKTAEIDNLNREVGQLNEKLKAAAKDAKELTEAQRRVARTMIITMAIHAYGYRPSGGRTGIANAIEKEAAGIGLTVDDGSARTWLRQSAQLVSKKAWDTLPAVE